tara:strand:+ start:69 stop:557 length:489 start_codon:yes stop_codon:yes gene_type:complete
MTVESASFISQLSTSNPAAGDNISEGDDHIRLVKTVLKTQFPNLATTAVNPTSAQLNKLGFETGSVMMWASNTTPTTQTISGLNDWLLCDGSSISTSTFSALFGVLGTVYGGAGSSFNLPDFRTFFPVGVGSGFVLGTSQTATASAGTAVLKVQPINFIIKT